MDESLAKRFALDRANAAAAESEARSVEAEFARIRNFQPPDPLAARRRAERENEARFAAEVELEAELNRCAAAAFCAKPPERRPWIVNWRQ